MAFSASLSAYWTKANDGGFQNRLAVALMKEAQYHLSRAQGGDSAERFAAIQEFARTVRARVTSRDWLVRYGLHALWNVSTQDVESDADLQALVTSVWAQLPDAALPA